MNIFDLKPNTTKFRIPQREGYEAVLKHFSNDTVDRHVLLQIPTGVGKTALIATLPFGVSKKKTLILTPNLHLSGQMEEDLDVINSKKSNIYKKLNILDDPDELELFVLRLENTASRADIDDSHIIISNYQQLATVEKWFKNGSDDIDLIIIDEAHHQKAKTYEEIIKFFPNAKVVSLTATPFRTDGKKIDGEKIYTYHFADAVKKGYIRNIQTINVTPNELALKFDDGDGQTYSLSQILEMKEEAWFRKGISTSQDCCNSIAKKSLEMLDKLKAEFPNEDHQIIATATSIREARERVKPAFERLGLKVGLVSSEHSKTNDEVKKKLSQGKIDVIINVNMLGEGFDHKPLGVAAIFKPFASLNPYIQFIGRAIRTNNEVNLCYVVSHLGLNQTARFKEFRLFDSDDKDFLSNLLSSTEIVRGTGSADEGGKFIEDDEFEKPSLVITELGEDILEFEDQFVDVQKIEEAKDVLSKLSKEERDILLKEFGVKPKLQTAKRKKIIKPKDRRRAEKNLLAEKEKSIAADILNKLKLGMHGRDFNPTRTNFVWVKSQISRDFNKKLGIEKKQRNDLSFEKINEFLNSDDMKSVYDERLTYYSEKLNK